MKRGIEMATAAAMTATMLAGCGQENQTSPNDPALQQAFEQTQDYWKDQGVGTSAQLVTLRERGDTFYCHNTEDTSDSNTMDVLRDSTTQVARYCTGEDTVVILSAMYESNRDIAAEDGSLTPEAYARFVVAHELGHHVVSKRGEVFPGDAATGEHQADCYAGVATAGLAANEVPAIASYLGSLPPSIGAHGTGDQRRTAYKTGAADPSGESCGLYHD